MKGVYPQASMTEIYVAALPFIIIDLFVITLMLLFPAVVLWLPAQMG
jgi:TRAP-type mannitol/chloroaromatic compound transport system permease large subunit